MDAGRKRNESEGVIPVSFTIDAYWLQSCQRPAPISDHKHLARAQLDPGSHFPFADWITIATEMCGHYVGCHWRESRKHRRDLI